MTRSIYATVDAGLAPVEVSAVQARTFWQRVDSDEEAAWSGVAIGHYAPVEVQHASLACFEPDTLARYRVSVVGIADDPGAGDLVGLGLDYDGETIIAEPAYAERTPEAVAVLRAQLAEAVDAEADRRILARYPILRQLDLIRAGEPLPWIGDVRDAATSIKALIPADAPGIASFDVAGHAAWPT